MLARGEINQKEKKAFAYSFLKIEKKTFLKKIETRNENHASQSLKCLANFLYIFYYMYMY